MKSNPTMATGQITRRHMLKAAGVTLALPMLDSFQPRVFDGAEAATLRRMLFICTPLGLHPEFFFPEMAGRDYEATPYLDVIKDFRDDYSVVSGLSHPEVG